MSNRKQPLATLLDLEIQVDVVDIGANPIDGTPPYKPLLDTGLARVVGFEPNPHALAALNARKGPNETYLPYVVFDGAKQTFRVCHAPGMSSLLEPNRKLLGYFHGFLDWARVEECHEVETVRLDDIEEVESLDYLKIDIQGGELEVFRNGVERLADCLVIHTEVEFLPMYEGQPLFSEVEMFLRSQGFVFHRFAPLVSRVLKPLVVGNDIYAGLSQLFWADAVFIRDFTRLDVLSPMQLKKMTLILHDIYGSRDVAYQALLIHDQQSGATFAERYLAALI